MILNISTTHKPATDLGYLLHKHPDKINTIDLSMGNAFVFFPEINEKRATISLLLNIDPIEMVRGKRNNNDFVLAHYVNDRPYVASSFMSVAISKAFSTAMNGICKFNPELVDKKLPFEVTIPVVPSPKGGEDLIHKLFYPLGYEIEIKEIILDEKFPNWGKSNYFSLILKNILTTKELLSHLYVLIPTLDNDKHYFINKNEIEKLLEKGKGWLQEHPQRDLISKRYLINIGSLYKQAIERLAEGEDFKNSTDESIQNSERVKRRESLNEIRLNSVLEKALESGGKTIIDLGCGEGSLIRKLIREKQFIKITGMDVSYFELIKSKQKLYYEEMSPKQKERVELFQGSLTYKDKRINGYDIATVIEVIEHLELNRLNTFERVLFELAKPKTIILTTPNKEYNVIWGNFSHSDMRHDDHRFEWNRKEFLEWATKVSEKYNYRFQIFQIGEELEDIGSPTQMGVFTYGN